MTSTLVLCVQCDTFPAYHPKRRCASSDSVYDPSVLSWRRSLETHLLVMCDRCTALNDFVNLPRCKPPIKDRRKKRALFNVCSSVRVAENRCELQSSLKSEKTSVRVSFHYAHVTRQHYHKLSKWSSIQTDIIANK